ncbi:unnamed protein product [Medioppia subpectinata]|uniref:PWWP domain-containing protein n=1 Tax=Medioppia subpectinata TaxID=1979941 RepID=A0A7R9KIM0_9ACAR|nr:unnamed protein product [Medioppia subpectinata]CAG2104193.1 unnamed protein product [Medioppia subpectinata]
MQNVDTILINDKTETNESNEVMAAKSLLDTIAATEDLSADTITPDNGREDIDETGDDCNEQHMTHTEMLNATSSQDTSPPDPEVNHCHKCLQTFTSRHEFQTHNSLAFHSDYQLARHRASDHVIDLSPKATTNGGHKRSLAATPHRPAIKIRKTGNQLLPKSMNKKNNQMKITDNSSLKTRPLKCDICSYIADSARALATHKVWHSRGGAGEGAGRPDRQSSPPRVRSMSGSSDTPSTVSSSGSRGRDNNGNKRSADTTPLESMDLVWAKCKGHPWYPALVVDPDTSDGPYKPAERVLRTRPPPTPGVDHYLVNYFDEYRLWQWLSRKRLFPIGVDADIDRKKLIECPEEGERKAVKMAFKRALKFMARSQECPHDRCSTSYDTRRGLNAHTAHYHPMAVAITGHTLDKLPTGPTPAHTNIPHFQLQSLCHTCDKF